MVPTVYEEFLRKFEAQPDIQVFLHLRALYVPHVTSEEKYSIAKTSLPNCYRLTIRHGYNDIPVTEDLGNIVYEEVRKYIITSSAQHSHPTSTIGVTTSLELSDEAEAQATTAASTSAESRDARLQRRLSALDAANEAQVVYIVGKEQLRLLSHNNVAKRFVLGIFLWVRDNTRAKVASMRIPVEKLVEVGFVKEI
jgi:KUP system potassium uptake protein